MLKLIGKGATALQNLQTLKWFSEAGIEVKWNLLYGFPGEDPADYAALAELLPSLYHLAPPLARRPRALDRFSPYFEDPARYGIANPRPNRAFRYVYPFPDESLARAGVLLRVRLRRRPQPVGLRCAGPGGGARPGRNWAAR